MKLEVRIILRDDLESRLKKIKGFDDKIDISSLPYSWLDADSDVVKRIFRESECSSGLRLYVNVRLTNSELKSVGYFEVRARKILKISALAQELNEEYMEAQPFIITSKQTRIKIREKVFVSGHLTASKSIISLEYFEACVCPKEISDLFLAEKLEGYKEYPVIDVRSMDEVKSFFLIGTTNILPPLEKDITIFPMKGADPDNQYYRRLGLPSYSSKAFDRFKDFNFTAESYQENDTGLLVVSSRMKEVCKKNNIKGIFYIPVLDRSTKLYQKYIEKFSLLSDDLSVNPKNIIS